MREIIKVWNCNMIFVNNDPWGTTGNYSTKQGMKSTKKCYFRITCESQMATFKILIKQMCNWCKDGFLIVIDRRPMTAPHFIFFEWQLRAGIGGLGSNFPYRQFKERFSKSFTSRNCNAALVGYSTVKGSSGEEVLIKRAQAEISYSSVESSNRSFTKRLPSNQAQELLLRAT